MKKERNLTNSILLLLPNFIRMFRNNVGKGWIGKTPYDSKTNTATIQNARRFESGLCVGSSDLIGWTSVEITPEMVGSKVAIFTAFEVKTKSVAATPQQINFIGQIKKNGGFAGIVKSYDDVNNIITWQKSEI